MFAPDTMFPPDPGTTDQLALAPINVVEPCNCTVVLPGLQSISLSVPAFAETGMVAPNS